MAKVDYHRDLKQVQSDGQLALWLSGGNQHAPFDRIEWFRALAEHCVPDAFIAAACDGEDFAVLPLRGASGHLHALSNWYTFRFRALCSGAERPLAVLAGDLAGKARRITLSGVPDEDGSAALLERAFRKAGWLVRREICDSNHVLPVAGRSYAHYLASRPGNLRTTLKRKAGKLDVEVLTRFDAAAWATYEAIYAESWKPEEGSPAFLRAFAQAEGSAGRLRLGIARCGGQAIAAQMWTVEHGTAWIHKLAHRQAAKHLSPGSVLSAALFRHVIDTDGVELVDFGTGDDPYKRDWMEFVRPRYRLDMLRPGSPLNWPRLGRDILRAGLERLAATAKRG
ncbi:GNAT family N-acetyltransferase [Novosphingobium lindaniclasticum]